MAINLRITTSNAEIRRQIFAELQKKESVLLNIGRRAVNDFIGGTLTEMMQSNVIAEIISNKRYRGEIGVENIGVLLRRFLRMFLKHIEPEIKWFTSRQSFEMSFALNSRVYNDLLAEPGAYFVTGGSKYEIDRGMNEVEWLNWLLLAGRRRVVHGFSFMFYKQNQGRDETGQFKKSISRSIQKSSRTGYGIMVPNSNGWGVPSQIAGTKDDNIFTRVLNQTIHKFQGFLEKRMEAYFGG